MYRGKVINGVVVPDESAHLPEGAEVRIEIILNGPAEPAGDGRPNIDDPDRWLDELSEGTDHLPPLPRELSAKDLYADHD